MGKVSGGRFKTEIMSKKGQDAEKGATKYCWFRTNSDEIAKDLEAEWLKKYQPKNSKIGKQANRVYPMHYNITAPDMIEARSSSCGFEALMTTMTVEIFNRGKRIESHMRKTGKDHHSNTGVLYISTSHLGYIRL